MIERLVLFGASGDLTGRYLLPALVHLEAAGELPGDFRVTGAAQAEWDRDGFREHARREIEEHAPHLPEPARRQLLDRLDYVHADATNADAVASALGNLDGPVAVYLALPPAVFDEAIAAVAAADPPAGSMIALEKPFGNDLESALVLNRQIADSFDEDRIFRVDHLLGMPAARYLPEFRTNPMIEPLWSGEHIDRVELLWEETIALEGRAGYFDRSGTLRDVMQNHLAQLLCLVAMEPADPGTATFREHKADLLRAVRIPDPASTRRARYSAGSSVPAYVDEEGVDPDLETETFAEVKLEVDTDRWRGTEFVLRAGKALAERQKLARLRFRPGSGREPNELAIGVDGPMDIRARLADGGPGTGSLWLESGDLAGDPTYAAIFRDLLRGGRSLAVSGEESELAWRIFQPVLDAWHEGRVPLEDYPAGSHGPQTGKSPGDS